MKTREEYNKYMAKNHMKRYYKLRKEAIFFLGSKCVECGETNNLELDHIDPATKAFDASRMLSVSLAAFWVEVKKCQLLCKKHHVEKTIKDSGKKVAKGTHGTLSSYRYCHCNVCRFANNQYTRKYRENHPRKKRIVIHKLSPSTG